MRQTEQTDFCGFSRPLIPRIGLYLFFALVALGISKSGVADDPPPRKTAFGEQNSRWPSGGPRNSPETVDRGYLFLDGEYIPAPYQVEYSGGEVRINGREISEYLSVRETGRMNPPGPMRGRWGPRPFFGGPRFASRTVINTLNNDRVVLLFEEEQPLDLSLQETDRFFEVLLDEDGRESADLSWLPVHADEERISEWLRSYEPPDALRDQWEQVLAKRRAIEDERASHMDAVRRLDQWGYPLTVLGFVLVVGAFGHLMSRRPAGEALPTPVNPAPEVIRQTNRSLIFVVAMSAMDLVWTILISQAGAMKELNPLGSQLLKDPIQLVVFKIALTALAVGLIFGLRRYRRAQEASWWGCLLFTILTVRWLTLNTLFV